jgi:hypothetical protein
MDDILIKDYIKIQYNNIPNKIKSNLYYINDSDNIKLQTFVKDNDFNNLNLLNYAYLDSDKIKFKLPNTSN